jgi:hypothetical protein
MGCDIYSIAERKFNGEWKLILNVTPLTQRQYSIFAFLANVRNYSCIPPISKPRGVPVDISREGEACYLGDHSYSWLLLSELLEFNYDMIVEDRRTSRWVTSNYFSGAEIVDSGKGIKMTLRKYLGEGFFEELNRLKEKGVERIIFGFDS